MLLGTGSLPPEEVSAPLGGEVQRPEEVTLLLEEFPSAREEEVEVPLLGEISKRLGNVPLLPEGVSAPLEGEA